MSSMLVAQGGTPAWVTILVALLGGLFGFVSGAAAAAVVTSNADRRERFRSRLIDAAEPYMSAVTNAFRILRQAQRDLASPNQSEPRSLLEETRLKVLFEVERLRFRVGRDLESADDGTRASILAEGLSKTYDEFNADLDTKQRHLLQRGSNALSEVDLRGAQVSIVFPVASVRNNVDHLYDLLGEWLNAELIAVKEARYAVMTLTLHTKMLSEGKLDTTFTDLLEEVRKTADTLSRDAYEVMEEREGPADEVRQHLLREISSLIGSANVEREIKKRNPAV